MTDRNYWPQQLQLQFLLAYQSEPAIWDPKHIDHKDKQKVNEAWKRIEAQIKKPVRDLKAKKDSLLATYRGYNRKVAASLNTGATGDNVYKPVWFAYELMDSFMGNIYNGGATLNNENSLSNVETMLEENGLMSTIEVTKQEEPSGSTLGSQRTLRRCADPPEPQYAAKQMRTSFESNDRDSEDECDLFGRLIAKKLKNMPEDQREEVMFEIHTIFHNYRTRYRDSTF